MATHIASKDREPLSGLVERVTFHSPDTGFCVLRVKVRGHRELVTVLGSAASIQPGEFIQASGRWDNHREHGIQFRTTFLKVMPPSSLDGIEKYLGSGMIKGIGPHFAKKPRASTPRPRRASSPSKRWRTRSTGSCFQVANHSTYHRGQVNRSLRQLGGEPPLVDYIAWVWFGKPKAEWDGR